MRIGRGYGVGGNQICATTRRSYVIEHATENANAISDKQIQE